MSRESKTESPVLSMDDVSFSYAGGRYGAGVEGISLSLGRGEVALLCGPSGCGKTTVTRIANGLAPHFYEGTETGTVSVCGIDVAREELWETARYVGSVFQNPKTQFYNVDVRGEVAFGCENLGFEPSDIDRRVDAAAREFDLAPLIDESLFSLSGGQKQRVACASAAAVSPALVVLDEPSSNLDFEAIAQLRSAIARWKAEGVAVLVAEHRIHYLEGIADHVLYLDDGRLARRWTADEFARLDDSERMQLGLRARSVDGIFHGNGRYNASAKAETQRAAAEKETVRFEGLTARCRKNGAFERILKVDSLELPAESVTALVGSCGAGKSTFAEAVCGLNRCDGTVILRGDRLGKRARRRKCFMVMQDASHQLFSESVLDEVTLGMEGPDRQRRGLGILRDLDLDAFAEDHPLSLSGGQRQRVAIAQALATNRRLVVYDEPTSGLDHFHMQQVAEGIRRLCEHGITQVVITHDPEFALSCCTHVAVMDGGCITEVYPLEEDGINRLASFFCSKHHAEEKRGLANPADTPTSFLATKGVNP